MKWETQNKQKFFFFFFFFFLSLSMKKDNSTENRRLEALVKEDKLVEIVLDSYCLDKMKLHSICHHLIFN